jgi:hypothetical protein
MRLTRTLAALAFLTGLATVPAWAGPPLICHAISIGSQPSLPWTITDGWNGAVPSYDVSHLERDALALLVPGAPVEVRMETLRRAAIYAARQSGLADALAASLMGRVMNAQAVGTPNPPAWFDAGYFAETLRQAARIYPLLHGSDRDQWMIRTGVQYLDGIAWMRMAVRLGGGEKMDSAVAAVERTANHR